LRPLVEGRSIRVNNLFNHISQYRQLCLLVLAKMTRKGVET